MTTQYRKAKTVRELIEYLQTWENPNQRIAYLIYTESDIEGDLEWYNFPSLTEAWETIVDEVQLDLTEGYHIEQFAEAIREITEKYYDLKDERDMADIFAGYGG